MSATSNAIGVVTNGVPHHYRSDLAGLSLAQRNMMTTVRTMGGSQFAVDKCHRDDAVITDGKK